MKSLNDVCNYISINLHNKKSVMKELINSIESNNGNVQLSNSNQNDKYVTIYDTISWKHINIFLKINIYKFLKKSEDEKKICEFDTFSKGVNYRVCTEKDIIKEHHNNLAD